MVKSTSCSSRGPGLKSQDLHDSSQLSVTPVPEDLMPCFGFYGHQIHMWCIDLHAGKIPIHTKTNKTENKQTNNIRKKLCRHII